MIEQEILDNLKSIEFKIKAIRELDKFWNLDITSLKHYGQMIELLVKELNDNINKYY